MQPEYDQRIRKRTQKDRSADRNRSAGGAGDRHPEEIGQAAGRNRLWSREDLGKILEYAREHPDSGSSVAIRLEALIGVRVGDLAYGIRIDQGKLRIKSKNGKWCERMITPEIRKILESESCRKLIDGDRIRFPKDGSINKYLLRTERKLGLEEHSFHDIRRRIAQDKYDEFRTSGMEPAATRCGQFRPG